MHLWKGYFFLFGSVCCFATSGIAGESIFRMGVDPLTVVSWRIVLACFALFLWLASASPQLLVVKAKDLPLFAFLGFVGIAAFQGFHFTTINLTSVATAVTLLYTGPSFIVIISYFVFKEPITRVKAFALIMTLAGCFLVTGGGSLGSLFLSGPEIGLWTGLMTGLTYAVYAILGKLFLGSYHTLTVLFYGFLFGSLPLLILSPPWVSLDLLFVPASSWRLFYLALVPTVLAYGLFLKGLFSVEAGRAGIFSTFEPVIAALLAYFLLGQLLSGTQVLGFVLVLLALIILLSPGKKKPGGQVAHEDISL